ncbi:MAG: HD domain-containing protein [Chloroflexota bacterium]|nr:HD domain-containing protein [Chloroflexota bacterium]
MSPYILLPLIEVLLCAGLLVLLMAIGRHHVARRPFALFLVFMTLWGGFIFLLRFSPSLSTALLWEKFVFGAILSASFTFYYFTTTLTGTRPARPVLYGLCAGYALVMALIPTGLVVTGMQLMWYGKAPLVGPLFPVYVLCVYIPIGLSLKVMLQHRSHSRSNDERIRDQYIIAGIMAMFIGGTSDYLPSLGVGIYPLGVIGGILFCILATIAMLRYGLLEMKVMLRKGATYSLVSMIIFGFFGSLIFLLSRIFQELVSPISLTITIVAVFIVAAVFQPVLVRLQRIVDRWFFRDRYDHLQALKRFSRETKGDLDLKQLATSLVTAVANGMQSGGVYLLLPSPATGNFMTHAYCGPKNRGRLSFTATSSLMITLKYHNRLVGINDMDYIPSLSSLPDAERQTLVKNDIELLVPLKGDGHLTGLLLLGSKISREPYSNEDRQLLQAISDEVAVNIENASRYEKVKQEHSELQKAMEGVIYAVSLVVETRDPYTAGHQRRVAELARGIALEMGFSEWQARGVHIAGLLHDVGKIAVPAEILSKPGKISQYEFGLIKNHSRVGYEILEKIEFPWPVPQAILQHHERLDGSGYPDGLSGDDVIMEARILGVADVVEAMSSHRPYRPALGVDAALGEISRARDILYDPEVADACVRLFQKNGFELEKLVSTVTNYEHLFRQVEEVTR